MVLQRELRIGNKLMFQPLGKKDKPTGPARMIEVKEIGQKAILVIDPIGLDLELFYGDKSLQPIPLSPDVLKRVGFELREKDGDYDYWYPTEDAMWSIRQEGNGKWQFCLRVRHDEIWKFDPIIESLHHLQNLYYSLTGQELTYNP